MSLSMDEICDFLRPQLTVQPSGVSYLTVKPAPSNAPDVRDRDLVLPMLLIHPEDEAGGPVKGLGGYTRQPRIERYAFVTICALADLKALRQLLDAVLIRQMLPGYVYRTSFDSGQTQMLDASVIWWKDIYQTQQDRSHQT